MRVFKSLTDPNVVRRLTEGGIVVIPTDTIYGIVARAFDRQAVERIYELRGRAPEKPCIILVADRWQITDKSLWTPEHVRLAEKYWPGGMSLVARVTDKTPKYLHRGTQTLAYRVPDYPELRRLLEQTGPLIAPSANLEGQPTATNIAEAEAYFGNKIDGYVDLGTLAYRHPSTVVTVVDGKPYVLRAGAVRIR